MLHTRQCCSSHTTQKLHQTPLRSAAPVSSNARSEERMCAGDLRRRSPAVTDTSSPSLSAARSIIPSSDSPTDGSCRDSPTGRSREGSVRGWRDRDTTAASAAADLRVQGDRRRQPAPADNRARRLPHQPPPLRAALVCKRWLGIASDRAFLRDFRKQNPPGLLGFCADTLTVDVPYQSVRARFVPVLPQPAELAVVARHLEAYDKEQRDTPRSADGFITGFWSGISTERGTAGALPPPALNDQDQFDGSFLSSFFICLHSDGQVHGLSHVYSSSVEANRRKRRFCTMNMYTLQDGAWRMRASAATQLSYTTLDIEPLLVDGKIYMRRVDEGDILVLDLTDLSFSTIPLPDGVEYLHENTMLSRADDCKVHLMHLKNLQLRIWLQNGDHWLLVDTICLRQLCDIPSMSDETDEDGHNAIIRVSQLGDNDEYVFLMIGQSALYLDIKRRALRKVYEVTEENQRLCYIHPFRMIWPPVFPALKDDPARSVM